MVAGGSCSVMHIEVYSARTSVFQGAGDNTLICTAHRNTYLIQPLIQHVIITLLLFLSALAVTTLKTTARFSVERVLIWA